MFTRVRKLLRRKDYQKEITALRCEIENLKQERTELRQSICQMAVDIQDLKLDKVCWESKVQVLTTDVAYWKGKSERMEESLEESERDVQHILDQLLEERKIRQAAFNEISNTVQNTKALIS